MGVAATAVIAILALVASGCVRNAMLRDTSGKTPCIAETTGTNLRLTCARDSFADVSERRVVPMLISLLAKNAKVPATGWPYSTRVHPDSSKPFDYSFQGVPDADKFRIDVPLREGCIVTLVDERVVIVECKVARAQRALRLTRPRDVVDSDTIEIRTEGSYGLGNWVLLARFPVGEHDFATAINDEPRLVHPPTVEQANWTPTSAAASPKAAYFMEDFPSFETYRKRCAYDVPSDPVACNDVVAEAKGGSHPIGQRFAALADVCLMVFTDTALSACRHALLIKEAAAADAAVVRKILTRLCEAGDGAACSVVNGPAQTVEAPKSSGNELVAKCGINDAASCAAIGAHDLACRLGVVASCDQRCIGGDLHACEGASEAIQSVHAASTAERVLPELFEECESNRKLVAKLETLPAADAKKLAYKCGHTLDDLELAIEWATNVEQPRYGKLIAEMKARCGTCPE